MRVRVRLRARSLGMLMWEMVSGEVPWKGLTDRQITTAVSAASHVPQGLHSLGLPEGIPSRNARANPVCCRAATCLQVQMKKRPPLSLPHASSAALATTASNIPASPQPSFLLTPAGISAAFTTTMTSSVGASTPSAAHPHHHHLHHYSLAPAPGAGLTTVTLSQVQEHAMFQALGAKPSAAPLLATSATLPPPNAASAPYSHHKPSSMPLLNPDRASARDRPPHAAAHAQDPDEDRASASAVRLSLGAPTAPAGDAAAATGKAPPLPPIVAAGNTPTPSFLLATGDQPSPSPASSSANNAAGAAGAAPAPWLASTPPSSSSAAAAGARVGSGASSSLLSPAASASARSAPSGVSLPSSASIAHAAAALNGGGAAAGGAAASATAPSAPGARFCLSVCGGRSPLSHPLSRSTAPLNSTLSRSTRTLSPSSRSGAAQAS